MFTTPFFLAAGGPVSEILEAIKSTCGNIDFDKVDVIQLCRNGMLDSHVHLVFIAILIFLGWRLFLILKKFCQLLILKPNNFTWMINKILPQLALLVFSSGIVVYYIGYDYGGTAGNFITLTIRSILSSFEMFLSKSNLIGIADNCREHPIYMFIFAVTHALAVMVSMAFAVACFGKRIVDQWRSLLWRHSKASLNVFWGFNEKSILLAKDIFTKDKKERIVFVDFPDRSEESKKGQSFSGIMGLLSYKTEIAQQLADIKYVTLKSWLSPDSIDTASKNILQDMDLEKLGKFIDKANIVNFFILTDDMDFNVHAAINLLDSEISEKVKCIYCCAERTKEFGLLAECSSDKLQIIDDSKTAVMEYAMRKEDGSECPAHPINFVEVDTRLGCVKTTHTFTAFIIGFGSSGQESMRFLYEFSAFPDSKGEKVPVDIHVFDDKMQEIQGELYQEIPALPEIIRNNEITLHPYNIGTTQFLEQLNRHITNLNYVVIATGNDERNLHIASMIYEYALQHRENRFDKLRIFVRLYKSANEYMFKKVIDTYAENHYPAIEYFGNPRNIYTKKWVIDDEEWIIADKFYKAYCKVSGDKYMSKEERRKYLSKKEGTKLLGYRRFDRTIMQDRANSKHCYTKEVLLGLRDMPSPPQMPDKPVYVGNFGKVGDDWCTRLLNVSICEHLRWNASHLMMGYLPMYAEESEKMNVRTDISCDESAKKHLCLVNWKYLPTWEDFKKYDLQVVETTINLYYDSKTRQQVGKSVVQ